jgi:hypothetical protein
MHKEGKNGEEKKSRVKKEEGEEYEHEVEKIGG